MTDHKPGQAAADAPPHRGEAGDPEQFFRWADGSSPRPALPAVRLPSIYLPPELAGLPAHDAEKWGDQRAEDGHDIVRLADLVHLLAERTGSRAVRVLAANLLDTIEADHLRTFYELQPGGEAQPIFRDEWLMPDTYPGRHYDPMGSSWCGTVECLRWCWATEAKGFAALDQGPHAAAAIRLSDAVRLFGVVVPQAVAPLSLVPASAGADEPAKPEMTAQHKPGEIWTDRQRDLLFEQWQWLTLSAPKRLSKKAAGLELSAIYGCHQSLIKKQRLAAPLNRAGKPVSGAQHRLAAVR